MKRTDLFFIAILVIAALLMTSCSAQNLEHSELPSETTTATVEPTPMSEQATVILTDLPEAEKAAFPVPEIYSIVDVHANLDVPTNLGFTIYGFVDANEVKQYRAFGQKISPADGSIIEQGWYAIAFKDEPVTAQSMGSLAKGERILALAKEAGEDGSIPAGSIVDHYLTGDEAKPYDETLFSKYDVVRKVLDFDELNAVPVNDSAAATGDSVDLPNAQPSGALTVPTAENKSPSSGTTGTGSKTSAKPDSGGSAENGSTGNGGNANDGKTWHDAVYEEVWVVDVPASSYEEPVYEEREVNVCNTCNTVIQGDPGDHAKAHMLNGENGGHHGEWITVQTGTRTVEVSEQGHYEKRLVKEAGWY